MIPGKKYRPEDIAEVAWRRRWYLVTPVLLMSIATMIVVQMLPNRYRSEAVVLIVPPRVPDDYVKSPITEGLQERLIAMQQQLLSRPRLERIIVDFDLYRSARKQSSMDEILERMKYRDIKVTVPKLRKRDEPVSFTVSYESDDPKTAMLVTERLGSLFVQENLEDRANLSDTTSQFMQSQVEDAARKLQEQGAKLEAFRRANVGRLPSEVPSNLQLMSTTQTQLQALNDTVSKQIERQLVIERTLSDEASIASVTPPATVTGRGGAHVQPVMSASQELASAREALATMQLRLKADHPDVRAQKRHIAELEQKAAAEALQQPVTDGGPGARPVVTQADVTQQRRIASLRTEYESLGRGIIANRQQADVLQKKIVDYRTRVESAPILESELTRLTREFETLQGSYTNLLRKTQDAQVAANLEQRQVGQQFRIVDPARIPERPTSPNRLRLDFIGFLAGLALGMGLTAFLEYRDTALRSEEDVLIALALPVVAMVPTMWTTGEKQRSRRRRILLASSAAATVVLSAAALMWKLRMFETWSR